MESKRFRGQLSTRTYVDHKAGLVQSLLNRNWRRDQRDRPELHPTADYATQLEDMGSCADNPSFAFCTRFVKSLHHKPSVAMFCAAWTPNGSRLATGSQSGRLTLWNGETFRVDMEEQGHAAAIRSCAWTRISGLLLSADEAGVVRYWQSNLSSVRAIQAHREAVRDISIAVTDAKFATASDDKTISVWDVEQGREDVCLQGHGFDVKTVAFHPFKGMIASGCRHGAVKLWDPRNGKSPLCSVDGAHKQAITRVRWNGNGNWLASASQDQLVNLWDIRKLGGSAKDPVQTLHGHERMVTSIAWHPQCEQLLCTGSYDGAIKYFVVNGSDGGVGGGGGSDAKKSKDACQAEMPLAHEQGAVWDLAWHPLGHVLCSASHDKTVRIWARNRPGDTLRDKFNALSLPDGERAEALRDIAESARLNPKTITTGKMPAVLEGFTFDDTDAAKKKPHESTASASAIPGLGSAAAGMERDKTLSSAELAAEPAEGQGFPIEPAAPVVSSSTTARRSGTLSLTSPFETSGASPVAPPAGSSAAPPVVGKRPLLVLKTGLVPVSGHAVAAVRPTAATAAVAAAAVPCTSPPVLVFKTGLIPATTTASQRESRAAAARQRSRSRSPRRPRQQPQQAAANDDRDRSEERTERASLQDDDVVVYDDSFYEDG